MPLPKKGTLAKPTALDGKAQALIVELLAAGNYLSTACAAAGITTQCYDYWKKLHDEGSELASTYSDFFGAVAKASASAEISSLSEVRMGEQGWQGPAWFLERRYPKKWGRKLQVNLPKDPKDMSDAELEAIAKGKGTS